MNSNLLEVKNVSKTFPGVRALNNVSINLKKGEVLALVGENGAGKSTLMKILSGAYPCTSYSGSILLEGREKRFHRPKDSEESGIEMIYQEISLILDLSVAENIYIGNYPNYRGAFVKWSEMFSKAQRILKRVGLEIDPMEKVRNLNTSQQQMVSIAKALDKSPKVLVLDEPTSTLTENEAGYLFKIIEDLKTMDVSCIYISHKLEEVFRIADRITVMRDGEVAGTVEKGKFDNCEIISMMVGRKIENRYPKEKIQLGGPVFSVEHLTVPHRYVRDKNLVEDISFSVRSSEILGLAGLVGAGRSEVVNAIFGNLKKNDCCELFIDGEKVEIKNPREAIKKGIALVTEDRRKSGIIGGLTIRENSTIVALRNLFSNCIIKYSKEKEIASEYKGKLAIKAPDVETKVRNLSGGNQQKVVLSKWLMNCPRILILDEPTRGIDVGSKYEIYKMIVDLAKQGIAIIMISSELPEILGMCDRILVLSRGRLVGEFDRENATEDKIMSAATGIACECG